VIGSCKLPYMQLPSWVSTFHRYTRPETHITISQ